MKELIIEKPIFEYLQTQDRPIYIYGMGDGAEKMISVLSRYGLKVSGFFASDEYVRGQSFLGFLVQKLGDIPKDSIILTAFGVHDEPMLKRFKEISENYEFYAPELPLFGELRIFDEQYYNQNIQEIEKAYSLLADDQSRKVFVNTINHRLSGKIHYLFEMETDKAEIYQELLKVHKEETYVDAGAYDGDTIRELLSFTEQKFKDIIAIEPDVKNFKKLNAKTEGLTLINKGIYNFSGTLSFSTEASRNSAIVEEGNRQIEVDTVDNIVGDREVTLVKMDVEGSEKEALEGALNTLKNQKPRLICAAYHKTGDFFKLVLQIKEINPDYEIYLRHQPYVPNWETNIIAI